MRRKHGRRVEQIPAGTGTEHPACHPETFAVDTLDAQLVLQLARATRARAVGAGRRRKVADRPADRLDERVVLVGLEDAGRSGRLDERRDVARGEHGRAPFQPATRPLREPKSARYPLEADLVARALALVRAGGRTPVARRSG